MLWICSPFGSEMRATLLSVLPSVFARQQRHKFGKKGGKPQGQDRVQEVALSPQKHARAAKHSKERGGRNDTRRLASRSFSKAKQSSERASEVVVAESRQGRG